MPRGVSRYDEARLQGRLWTPRAMFGDMASWYDFGNLGTLRHATGISHCYDVRDNALYQEQGTGSLQPSLSATGINGRRCASFDGAGDYMLMFASPSTTWDSSFLFGGVFSCNAAGTDARPVCWIRAAGGNDYDNSGSTALLYRSAANTLTTYQNGASRASTNTATDGVVQIFIVESDGTNVRHFRNGTAGGTGTWGTIAFSTGKFHFGVFSTSPSVTNYGGLYGEMVALRGYKGSAGRHRLEGYLAHKWGLASSLAGTHPYKNAPPLIGA